MEYVKNKETHIGKLNFIFLTRRKGTQVKVVLIKHMHKLSSHADNTAVVVRFGHTRYAYELRADSEDDVVFDCIFPNEIHRCVPLVPDMPDIDTRYNLTTLQSELLDNSTKRRLVSFFY